MKLLYLGTVCNAENYEKEISKYKIKPSVAPLTFETALINGFAENNFDVDILSFPMIPAFPGSNKPGWGRKKEKLPCGYSNVWISAINVMGLKQFTQGLSSKRIIKKWFRQNVAEKKAVLIYSIYQPVAKNVIRYSKKYKTPCVAIVPDLPRDMYANKKVGSLKKVLTDIYTKKALRLQGDFDGYVYLTEAMAEEISPDSPYIVVEGIANVNQNVKVENTKEKKRAIMYAGALSEKYGLANLLDAFSEFKEDAELWIFGAGDYEEEIKKRALLDERIKFFGRKSRDEILEREKKATLLVNVRDCNEEFTKFSFPSKTIEYMLSGTPVLTTKLKGIPEEYFDYVFGIENNSADAIRSIFENIFKMSDEELHEFGYKAENFIKENKNGAVQAKKIIDFFEGLI